MIFPPVRIPRLYVIASIIKNNEEGLLKLKTKGEGGNRIDFYSEIMEELNYM